MRRPADTVRDLDEPEVEVAGSGMFERARAAAAARQRPMELSLSDVEVVKLTREEPVELSVTDVEVVKFLRDEPIKVSKAPPTPTRPIAVLKAPPTPTRPIAVLKAPPTPTRPIALVRPPVALVRPPVAITRQPMRPAQPTNPCIAFERTFALEFAKTIAAGPLGYQPQQRWTPPQVRYEPPRVRVVDPMSDAVPMPRAQAQTWIEASAPKRRKSLIPRATFLMGLVVLGGVLSDEAKAGRLDRLIGTASAWIDLALGR